MKSRERDFVGVLPHVYAPLRRTIYTSRSHLCNSMCMNSDVMHFMRASTCIGVHYEGLISYNTYPYMWVPLLISVFHEDLTIFISMHFT